MGTNNAKVKMFDSVEEAPIYGDDFTAIHVEEFVVVGNGTVEGRSTVDIVLTCPDGRKYVAMITGGILQIVAGAIVGQEDRLKDGAETHH